MVQQYQDNKLLEIKYGIKNIGSFLINSGILSLNLEILIMKRKLLKLLKKWNIRLSWSSIIKWYFKEYLGINPQEYHAMPLSDCKEKINFWLKNRKCFWFRLFIFCP